jgi:Zn-dependent protease
VKYAWHLGRVFGINLFLHWSFWLLPAWVAMTSLSAGATLGSAVGAAVFVLAVFCCVVLHELGHALTARHYGIATHDITLLPIGGVARLERMPKQPEQELAIALAGPAVNFVIAAVLLAARAIVGASGLWAMTPPGAESLLAKLAWVNVALAAFNLLPAFPMDGGRVLRALLALRVSHAGATQIAAIIGLGMAICLAILGVAGNPALLFVALFVFWAARSEARLAGFQSTNTAEPTATAQTGSYTMLPAHARADDVARALFTEQYYFPVVQEDTVIGVLSKAALLTALANGQGDRLVAELAIEAGNTAPHATSAKVKLIS